VEDVVDMQRYAILSCMSETMMTTTNDKRIHFVKSYKFIFVNDNVSAELKRCVDKLSKSTYPSLAPITVFVISGLQSVIY